MDGPVAERDGSCSPVRVVSVKQLAAAAGHSVHVLLRIYAKCIVGQDELAKRRISEALRQA